MFKKRHLSAQYNNNWDNMKQTGTYCLKIYANVVADSQGSKSW